MPATQTILKAALLAGSLDIAAAFVQVYLQTGKEPVTIVLKFIAAGLIGKNSTLAEPVKILVGLLVHFFIAGWFTLLFFISIAKWRALKNFWLLIGFLYGFFIWAVMNLLVLPVTNTRHFVYDPSKNALALGILILCIGLPLSYIASRQQRLSAEQFISSGSRS